MGIAWGLKRSALVQDSKWHAPPVQNRLGRGQIVMLLQFGQENMSWQWFYGSSASWSLITQVP